MSGQRSDHTSERNQGEAHGGVERDDHMRLHDRLRALPEPLFEEVLLLARVDRKLFAAQLAICIVELARLADQDPDLHQRLTSALDTRAASRLGAPVLAMHPTGAMAPGRDERVPSNPVASDELLERLARMKRDVVAILRLHPQLLPLLASRLACDPDPEIMTDFLFGLKGCDVAEHLLHVSDAQTPTREGEHNCEALQSMLCIVLPYVSDWREEVESVRAGHEVIALRYSSATIAEAVMAGGAGRQARFEYKPGGEPYGVGAVQVPSVARTALFTTDDHLRESVVKQLAYQLGVGGAGVQAQRTRVRAALAIQGRRQGGKRMRYYFLFRDAEENSGDVEPRWSQARRALHGDAGVPGLLLVRLQGTGADSDEALDEAHLAYSVALILEPRTPTRT